MSMTPEIASKIINGMRLNLKQVILPQLQDMPYPTEQAVSMYLLLKMLAGFTSNEFQKHIQSSNNEIREVLLETLNSFPEYFSAENEAADDLRRKIDISLKSQESGNENYTEHQELTESLTQLIKAIWGGIEMKDEAKGALRGKVNNILRKQLDRELALFT
jgi:hypothetical protein